MLIVLLRLMAVLLLAFQYSPQETWEMHSDVQSSVLERTVLPQRPEIEVVQIDPEPQPASTQSRQQALEGALALIRERKLVGMQNFWRLLEESNAKQRQSLVESRRYNRQHSEAIKAKTWIQTERAQTEASAVTATVLVPTAG